MRIKPLKSPITTHEVFSAVKKLRNNRAAGPDAIPGELLKYGTESLNTIIADTLNQVFEKGEDIELGTGTLIVLPKPGKPAGLLSRLRPIVLLNTVRKVLSIITLNRIRPAVDSIISPCQSGFRPNRSTADAVWAHKWMIARIMKVKETIHVLGIDLSRAFDTIDRDKLLEEMQTIVDEDCWRMTHALLNKTTLVVRIKSSLSKAFETNIGTPQGDALSPVLFTLYLELALRKLREVCPQPMADASLPAEIEYADDTDFISSVPTHIESIKATAPTFLQAWNLSMNTEKTEHTILKREGNKEDETWRKTKKLGTLLGDNEELKRRKQLATSSMANMWKVWSRKNNKISLQKRILLYNSYITPILAYNSGTWALSKAETEELDRFHRKQLRSVIGVYYPNTISNVKLYERCKCDKMSSLIRKNRWRLLGHVLRMANNIPAKKSMLSYFNEGIGFRGRPRITLPSIINSELEAIATKYPEIRKQHQLPAQLKSVTDLQMLEQSARQRKNWSNLVDAVHVLLQ